MPNLLMVTTTQIMRTEQSPPDLASHTGLPITG